MRAGVVAPRRVFERDARVAASYTEFPEGAPSELPDEYVHPAIEVEAARRGATELAARCRGGVLALDDAPFPLWEALRDRNPLDAGVVLAPAKLTKTLDELECIRQAQASTSAQCARSGRSPCRARAPPTSRARSCAPIAELGADANTVDPVFQVMPTSIAAGPYSRHRRAGVPAPDAAAGARAGRRACGSTPASTCTATRRTSARRGSSATSPTTIARVQFAALARRRRPRARDRAAGRDGRRPRAARRERSTATGPWLSYFYLAHGIGTDSAEMPFVGTDLGDAFDASIVLATGHGARVRARDLGRRPRRAPIRGDRRGHRRRLRVAVVARRARRRISARERSMSCSTRWRATASTRWCSAAKRTREPSRTRRRLWLAGTRAFAPSCVVIRERAAVHVLANSDDAVPEGFPVEQLYGITWNPEKLVAALAAIPASRRPARVAVDGMTPMMHTLLSTVSPEAELVDAAPVLTRIVVAARSRACRRGARRGRGRVRRPGGDGRRPGSRRTPARRCAACARRSLRHSA